MNKVLLKYQLRNYQHKWIEDIFRAWSRGQRRVLAQLACGAGLTVCFAHISHQFFRRNQKVLVIAHRTELITQAAEKLAEVESVPIGIIKVG